MQNVFNKNQNVFQNLNICCSFLHYDMEMLDCFPAPELIKCEVHVLLHTCHKSLIMRAFQSYLDLLECLKQTSKND